MDNKVNAANYKEEDLADSLSKLEIKDETKTASEKKEETKNDNKYNTFISKLKKGEFKDIVFMTGAGISTSSGIPDFRSKNGIFHQLQTKYNLSTPEEFFDIKTFLVHPEYFYEFSKSFLSSSYDPTTFHYFMGFLCHKKMVKYVFTQNIDGLDSKCGIDADKLIFAHGSFTEAHCPKCHNDIDIEELNECVMKLEVKKCPKCKSPCKHKIVFYGEDLSPEFYQKMNKVSNSDLGIVCGTSLLVSPFNCLPYMFQKKAWRVVINKSEIGDKTGKKGFKYDKEDSNDLLIKGYSDAIAEKIINDCGWKEEFEAFVKEIKEQNKNK